MTERKRRYSPIGTYSVLAAAQALGITHRQVQLMIDMKQIKAVQFGRRHIIPPSEIARLRHQFEMDATPTDGGDG